MSWMCSGKSNKELVENLCRSRLISSARVKQAMLRVDRANFLSGLQLRDNELKTVAYRDSPLGIGYDATISAPHMHAHCLEWLKDHLVGGNKALDVGSGSGYLTACMYAMVEGEGGAVFGIDHIPELVRDSISNMKSQIEAGGFPGLIEDDSGEAAVTASTADDAATAGGSSGRKNDNIHHTFRFDDARRRPSFPSSSTSSFDNGSAAAAASSTTIATSSSSSCSSPSSSSLLSLSVVDGFVGLPEEAKKRRFDAIHVGAAAPHIPTALKEQLAVGGRMIIPVGTNSQIIIQVDRLDETTYKEKELVAVRYVPLVQHNKE